MLSLMTQAFLLFEEATPAAEEETSGVALLLPDKNEAIAGVIAFAIVFFFIWKWAVPRAEQDARSSPASDSVRIRGRRGFQGRGREPVA